MVVAQDVLGPADLVQVGVHVLEQQIYIFGVVGPDHLLQVDDVGVPQLQQKHDLSVDALGIGGVGEGIEVFL